MSLAASRSPEGPRLAPTPRDTLMRDGAASLLRFVPRQEAASNAGPGGSAPVLLVPSMINRWYVLDLREGFSVAEALVDAGLDTWCLDWGVSGDEDRHLGWDDVLARLRRAIRQVQRRTGASQISLVGYCMGGTLCAIHAAQNPDDVAGFVDLMGPIDFSYGGKLRRLVDRRWFPADAIADAGNIAPEQMQAGFLALRPTGNLSKSVHYIDKLADPEGLAAFGALEAWAGDNVPFPATAYVRYIRDLYQHNALVEGTHRVLGRAVDLRDVTCPVLTIVASRDEICPPAAAKVLRTACPKASHDTLEIPGGHVGAVVGPKAPTLLYPALTNWLRDRSWNSIR